jgi:two-component system, sensor histidine kinase and response regulator
MPSASVSAPNSNSAILSATLKPTLLVVDDEEGPRASLKVVFSRDFEVLLAPNGREAIRIAKERQIDIAILDILMHGMSGVEVLKELKDIDEGIEVIMLTAYETLETARQALRLGAREYLNKPFDIPTLRTAAAKALEKRRTNRKVMEVQSEFEHLQRELHEQTEKAEAAKNTGAIYGSVLHDLNSPLTVINGFIELLQRQVNSASSLEGDELEKMRNGIARVHSQVVRCIEISRRYLGFLRNGQSDPDSYVGVNQVLQDLQELLVKHPSCEGNELTVQDLDSNIFALVHGTDLLQILLNLTINALQACTTAHRVEVVAQILPEEFDLSSFKDGPGTRFISGEGFDASVKLIAISVRDNGPGMPPEVLAKAFNEQFTTKAPGKGTGLGLGIVKRLTTHAKGAILLTTGPQGTKFTVLFPVKP